MVGYRCRQVPTTVGKEPIGAIYRRAKGGNGIEDEKMIKKLKSTLMKIATADASEILRTFSTNGEIDKEKKISKKLSVAISSIKIKTTKDAVECEVKTVDKLKAIELCLKLLGADCSEGKSDILVNYDYNENSTDE